MGLPCGVNEDISRTRWFLLPGWDAFSCGHVLGADSAITVKAGSPHFRTVQLYE